MNIAEKTSYSKALSFLALSFSLYPAVSCFNYLLMCH